MLYLRITFVAGLLSLPLLADAQGAEPVHADFNPDSFSRPIAIDNRWLPLQPGNTWRFEGTSTEDGERILRRVDFFVTDLTKQIGGVETVVAWVNDYDDSDLVGSELAFYAQDDSGNIWYFGEYPEEYEDSEFMTADAWIAGLEDARAGVKMWAQPQLDTPSYYQGWGPAVDWTDYAAVSQIDQETCVPAGCYTDVMIIDEASLEEPGALKLEYYAPGVGNIRVGWKGDDSSQEALELVSFSQLSPAELSDVRDEALALERNAYERSEVYAQTPPASPTPNEEGQGE